MRTRAAIVAISVLGLTSAVALAQHHPTAHPGAGAAPAASGSPAPAAIPASAAPVASAAPTGGASASPAPAWAQEHGATSATSTGGGAGGGGGGEGGDARSFDIPMVQRGTGSLTHFPIPEQLARNDVPVFVQVRSSAPIDHVSMFYRGQGSSRFREIRMGAMGQNVSLPGGYGAVIPCEDSFPPAVEYYVEATATSGVVVGGAGTSQAPIRLAIVRERSRNFVPTLPGQSAPRNCGSLVVSNPTGGGTNTTGTGTGRTGGTNTEPAAHGTADLGEPCVHNNDCLQSLRCGSNHRCVFNRGQ